MNLHLSNLPPGVTDAMIEAQIGPEPTDIAATWPEPFRWYENDKDDGQEITIAGMAGVSHAELAAIDTKLIRLEAPKRLLGLVPKASVAYVRQGNIVICLLLLGGRLYAGASKRAAKYDRWNGTRGYRLALMRAVEAAVSEHKETCDE